MIRAKMRVDMVASSASGEEVRMSPVYGPDGTANAEWSKLTPSGSLYLFISNPEARGKIKAGGFYFVDLTEADEAAR